MLETDDWKREKIGDYRALSAIVAKYTLSIQNDVEIGAALAIADAMITKAEKLALDRKTTIAEAKEEQQMIKMELLDHWDTDGKSFKCDMGSATIRINKTLIIKSENELINHLERFDLLPQYIKSFDMSKLRKLKDAHIIGDDALYYKKNTIVAIKEAKE
jgi:hypothetical protein